MLVRRRARSRHPFIAPEDRTSATLREACRRTIGLDLPIQPGFVEHDGLSRRLHRPEQWLADAGPRRRFDLGHAAPPPRLRDDLAALVEVGDGRGVLEVSGPRARDALGEGRSGRSACPRFRPGGAASTMARADRRHALPARRRPDVPRSSCYRRPRPGSFWHWLDEASGVRPCGGLLLVEARTSHAPRLATVRHRSPVVLVVQSSQTARMRTTNRWRRSSMVGTLMAETKGPAGAVTRRDVVAGRGAAAALRRGQAAPPGPSARAPHCG